MAVASYTQVFIVYTWVFPKVAVLWQWMKIYWTRACIFKSVSSIISKSEESVIQCRISTNYEQSRQSVVQSQRLKSYWKSRAASNSSCIFLERGQWLRGATKIVATEIGQVRQTVTKVCSVQSAFWTHAPWAGCEGWVWSRSIALLRNFTAPFYSTWPMQNTWSTFCRNLQRRLEKKL
jgi:hypothetical protein